MLGAGALGVEPLGGSGASASAAGAVTKTLTVTVTASGVVGRPGAVTKTLTVSTAAAGRLGLLQGAALAAAVTIAATGTVVAGVSGDVARPASVALAASGVVGTSSSAPRAIAITTTAAGRLGVQTGAARPITAAIAATGAVVRAGDIASNMVVAIAATGEVYTGPTGRLDQTVTIDADGVVTVPAETVVSWGNGRYRDGIATATWEPPVVAPPSTPAVRWGKAYAIDSVAIAGARAVLEHRMAALPRLRHRVLVNHVDMSYFRGVELPEPTIGLVEPLLWGSGSITWPQIHAQFENPGHGALAMLAKEAPVRIQLVDVDTDEVVDPDYFVGFIGDYDNDGDQLVTSLEGKAVGRARTSHRPQPLFPANRDIGTLAVQTLKGVLHLPTMANAPDTGIVVPDSGDVWQLDFLTDLTARSTQFGGAQWTIMPNAGGIFRMFRKDVTTLDFTVYTDGDRAVANLRRDFAEETNREFATAVADNGMRIRNGMYPGLSSRGVPPAFPGHLEEGDTDTGSETGVFTLSWRLKLLGYLSSDPSTFTTFTPALTKAVRRMQDAADLTITGEVDASTWRAAWDGDRTGWTLKRARITPAAEKPYTRAFKTNASGQIIGRNPRYQRQTRHVDRIVDMERVKDRDQMKDWAENDLVDQNDVNYTGTLVLNMGAVIRGEHNAGDPLDSSMLEDVRWIKPGMNAWLPIFRGGIRVHVASVDHETGSATLAVDTRNRDALPVWEIHNRNREAIRHRARQWHHQQKSSNLGRDAMTGWDEIGGFTDGETCPDHTWTVFPVVAGQEGQIRDLKLQTVDDPTEFVLAIFGKRISGKQIDRLIGDPFTDAGKRAWRRKQDTLNDDHWLLYEAGWDGNPCGYSPTSKPDAHADFPEKGDDQVTGKWHDSGGFAYFCDEVLWVAMYPKNDTHIQPGRIMRVQLDDAV